MQRISRKTYLTLPVVHEVRPRSVGSLTRRPHARPGWIATAETVAGAVLVILSTALAVLVGWVVCVVYLVSFS